MTGPTTFRPSDEPAADPIDQLIAAGVTPRELIAYPLDSVDWLARHQGETFRLCYHDDAGAVVVESVKATALLRRAAELGWGPHGEDLYAHRAMCMFDHAVYHVRRGVHWYASATDDTDRGLPLGWPTAVLEANARRDERERKARMAKFQREAKRQERATNLSYKETLRSVAMNIVRRSEEQGKPISYATARRNAGKDAKEIAALLKEKLCGETAA